MAYGGIKPAPKGPVRPIIKKAVKVAKTVGYDLPKAILRKTFTNANVSDVFNKNVR